MNRRPPSKILMVREQWLVQRLQVTGFAVWEKCSSASAGRMADFSSPRSRAASAALVLTGKEIARKKAKNDCLFRFRCTYQPGTLEAVVYNAAGQETGRCALTTAGSETELRAEPEEAAVHPGQLCYIRLRYTDQNGVLKPTVREPIRVQVTGGRLLALGNACPFNLRGYHTTETDPYWGEALAIVEAGSTGCVTLHAESKAGRADTAVQVHKE